MKVGRFYGIDVHIHWTFWLLILYYLVAVSSTAGLVQAIIAIAFVASVFFCVILHEYGHALTARRYGIPTVDITLMPIGGVARLERMPERPWQEFVVAIAGPLVNLAIAAVLFVAVVLNLLAEVAAPTFDIGTTFFQQLLVVNLFLALFNLLPAFPMDGGRILRSLLAMRLDYLRATEIAARIGRWMALAIALWGLFHWNPILLILALFVFSAGTVELMQVRYRMHHQADTNRWTTSWQKFQFPRSDSDQQGTAQVDESQVIDAVDYRQIR